MRTSDHKPTRVPRQPPRPLPPSFIAVATLLRHHDAAAELYRALEAAEQALMGLASVPSDIYPSALHKYIRREAEQGPRGEHVRKVTDADDDIGGHLQNAYAGPGMLVGAALAWLILTDRGTR